MSLAEEGKVAVVPNGLGHENLNLRYMDYARFVDTSV